MYLGSVGLILGDVDGLKGVSTLILYLIKIFHKIMRTQIALAALVAFAAAQDEVSIEDAMAAAMEEALSQMTDEERAAWEAAQGALGDMGDMAVDMGDMAESGGDWEGEWDDKDMMDGGWSPELDSAK